MVEQNTGNQGSQPESMESKLAGYKRHIRELSEVFRSPEAAELTDEQFLEIGMRIDEINLRRALKEMKEFEESRGNIPNEAESTQTE